jgi:hypothetical protein
VHPGSPRLFPWSGPATRLAGWGALFGLLFGAPAQAARLTHPPPQAVPEWKLSGETAFATRYVDRGITLSHDTWQPSFTLERGAWSGGVWTDLPTPSGELSEFDPWLQYGWSDGAVAWSAGATHIYYPEASGTTLRHSTELFLSRTQDWFVTPAFVVNLHLDLTYDVRLRTLYLDGRAAHSQSLAMLGVPLEFTFALLAGHVDARDINPDDPSFTWRDAHRHWGAQLEIAWNFSERGSFKLLGQIDGATNVDPAQGATGNTSLTATFGWAW